MNSSNKKIEIIDWKPSRDLELSLVDQIVGYVKNRVFRGDWVCGDILPPQRELAEIWNVNRSTIVSALSELAALGIIESKVGKGTVIANSSWSLLFENSTPNWEKYIEDGFHKSNLPTIQAINKYEFVDPIIRLSTGEVSPELMPHEAFSKVLMKMADLKIPYNYLEPLGLYELRVELCKHFKKYNLNVKPNEVLIVSGSLQALQLISVSILGGSSNVFVEENSYVKSLKVFEFSGIQMKAIPVDRDGPMPWMIDEDLIKKGNQILYTIPTFHNPTGLNMPNSRRIELLKWCKKNMLPVIEDDAYRDLYLDEAPPDPIKSYDDSGNVLYIGSVSKSLAPGLRIGWVVGPESIIERLGDIKMQTDYGASSISQWMLKYLLEDNLYEEHIVKLREKLKVRSLHLLGILEKYFFDIATWNKAIGGFYIWLRLNEPLPMKKLFERALKKDVLINPGYIYGFKENNYIRLSYCYSSLDEMDEGMKRLSDIIKEMIGEK